MPLEQAFYDQPGLRLDLDNNIVRVPVALSLGEAVTKPHLCQRPVDRLGHDGLSGVNDGLNLNVTPI